MSQVTLFAARSNAPARHAYAQTMNTQTDVLTQAETILLSTSLAFLLASIGMLLRL
ncbi:MAG: hypothetical protein RIC56_10900 [Pseudomonadales bacterium]